MDSIPLLLALLLGVAAALVILLLFRRRGGEGAALAQIAGRLDQLAQSHAAQQAALDARLQSQERNLAKTVEDRLSDLNKRVGDKLQESSEKAGESLTQLAARLAVIDRAQANIMELSGQVVGPPEHPLQQAGARGLRRGPAERSRARPAGAREL